MNVGAIIRRGTLGEIALCQSPKKASASIIEQVHDFYDEYILTTLRNSGVYDNKWVLNSNCTMQTAF